MIVVKIELWPFGAVGRARELGRMAIANGGTASDPSLYVAICRNDTGLEIATVHHHVPSDGFWPLVAQVATAASARPTRDHQLPTCWTGIAEVMRQRMYAAPSETAESANRAWTPGTTRQDKGKALARMLRSSNPFKVGLTGGQRKALRDRRPRRRGRG